MAVFLLLGESLPLTRYFKIPSAAILTATTLT